MHKVFVNPFSESKNVQIIGNFTDNKPINIPATITLSDGYYTYQYIVDGIKKCSEDKIQTFINGIKSHYFIIKNKDYDADWLKIALDAGDSDALFIEAGKYAYIIKDYTNAKIFYLEAIYKGQLDAIVNYALFCKNIMRDYDSFIKYMTMAVYKGYKRAAVILGNEYAEHKQIKTAMEYWSIAGNIDAFDSIFKYNPLNANEYLNMQIENGNTEAMIYKARLTKSQHYYKMAIDNGFTDATYDLADYYYNVEHNYVKYEEIMSILAIKYIGYAYNLAKYYTNKQSDKYLKYMLLDATRDFIPAMYELGIYYLNILNNSCEAIKWFENAAKHNDDDSMFQLAAYYQNIDNTLFTKWLNKACENYNLNAIQMRAKLGIF